MREHGGCPAELWSGATRRLDQLNPSQTLRDLDVPPAIALKRSGEIGEGSTYGDPPEVPDPSPMGGRDISGKRGVTPDTVLHLSEEMANIEAIWR